MSIFLTLEQSLFPDLPRTNEITDKDGKLNEEWRVGFAQIYQALQVNFSNEGIALPPVTPTQQAVVVAFHTNLVGSPLPIGINDISGRTIYDPIAQVPKVFILTFDGATPPNVVSSVWKTYTIT